jgi:hypothetical protein
MKNIFILPTTEPSQVYLVKSTNALGITSKDPESMKYYGSGTNNLHVYITNKDPYEKGDWIKNVTIDLETPFPLDADGIMYTTLAPCDFEKIVLTSDPKLIADGVAEISIEFLRLLKGKKLDDISTIEVEKTPLLSNNGRALFGYKYTPIIPSKEEPKKRIVILAGEDAVSQEFEQIDQNNPVTRGSTALICKQETQQERERGVIITPINKQETPEEAGEKLYPNRECFLHRFQDIERKAFAEGVKWEKYNSNINALEFEIKALKSLIQDMDATIKSKYSEEEVLELLKEVRKGSMITSSINNRTYWEFDIKSEKKWFEQLKKK